MAGEGSGKMEISPARGRPSPVEKERTCEPVSWVEELSYKLTRAHDTPSGTARSPVGGLVTTRPVVTKERDLARLTDFKRFCHDRILIGHIAGKIYNVRELLRLWSHRIELENKEIEVKIDKLLVNGYVTLKVGSRENGEVLVSKNPHYIQTKLLFLQHWVDDFNPEYPITMRHALHVKLFGVPLAFQDEKLLECILEPVGIVLVVEMGDGKSIPPSAWIACYLAIFVPEIEIEGEFGRVRTITLEYKDLDLRCWACRSAAHGYRTCPVGPYEGFVGEEFQSSVVFENLGAEETPHVQYPSRYNYDPINLVKAGLSQDGIPLGANLIPLWREVLVICKAVRNEMMRTQMQQRVWSAHAHHNRESIAKSPPALALKLVRLTAAESTKLPATTHLVQSKIGSADEEGRPGRYVPPGRRYTNISNCPPDLNQGSGAGVGNEESYESLKQRALFEDVPICIQFAQQGTSAQIGRKGSVNSGSRIQEDETKLVFGSQLLLSYDNKQTKQQLGSPSSKGKGKVESDIPASALISHSHALLPQTEVRIEEIKEDGSLVVLPGVLNKESKQQLSCNEQETPPGVKLWSPRSPRKLKRQRDHKPRLDALPITWLSRDGKEEEDSMETDGGEHHMADDQALVVYQDGIQGFLTARKFRKTEEAKIATGAEEIANLASLNVNSRSPQKPKPKLGPKSLHARRIDQQGPRAIV